MRSFESNSPSVGMDLNLRASKKHLDGDYGMFVEPNHVLAWGTLCRRGMSRDKFFHTLAHEYVHFLQWFADDPLYRASRDDARDYYASKRSPKRSALENCSGNGISFPSRGG